MSRHFYASELHRTTAPLLTRPDIPVGTVIAIDREGEWYILINLHIMFDDPEAWPKRTPLGIPLWRDNWRIAFPGSVAAPDSIALRNVNMRKIK